jgi:hypothetical protein
METSALNGAFKGMVIARTWQSIGSSSLGDTIRKRVTPALSKGWSRYIGILPPVQQKLKYLTTSSNDIVGSPLEVSVGKAFEAVM